MFLLMVGTATSFAQETILRGAQVTKESDLVSGKPYILYYVGNQASCYVKASSGYTYFQIAPDDNTISDEAIFIFTKEETTWKIQSQKTGKYFPTPNSIDEFGFKPAETGGSWTLNFQQDGTIAPYCGDYCLDRSNGKLHSNTIDGTFPRNVSILHS